ncbi:MAG: hypothetical protein ACKVX7_08195 [Planctomycetota bacterium]
MSRIAGVETKQASLFVRLMYKFVRRAMGKAVGVRRVPKPFKVKAHHVRLLVATSQMELGQQAAKSVPAALKSLASLAAARLIGCPF